MGDSQSSKPGARPGGLDPPAKTPAAGNKPAPGERLSPADAHAAGRAGRVVHDERGNAVWDWIKETSRIAIDSTSRLLKKLEIPELKLEDTQNEELRLESDRDPGGGYNPYGGSTPGHSAGRGGAAGASNARVGSGNIRGGTTAGGSRGVGSTGGTSPGAGGGYDPYGKSVSKKPSR